MQKDLNNLLNLRNLMKRDPSAYYEEFKQQHRHFEANLQIFKIQDSKNKDTEHFANLIEFLAHVAPSFPDECARYPTQLLELISEHYAALDSNLRRCIVQSLILLLNRVPQHISRIKVYPVFFTLFRCPDKVLRSLLFSFLVNDVKRMNRKTQNNKLNSALQSFMFNMLGNGSKDSAGSITSTAGASAGAGAGAGAASSGGVAAGAALNASIAQEHEHTRMAAKKSLQVMIELWRRKVWRDEKTVNAISNACFYKDTAIKVLALRFFLGVQDYDEEKYDEDRAEAVQTQHELKRMSATAGASKRRHKRERDMKRVAKQIKRKESGEAAHSSVNQALTFPAIHLVYDPQKFAERLFSQLQQSGESFDTRMLMMNVISRFVGAHKLFLLNFYPYLQKYMQPHQKNVTHILVYLAQSSHELVPPDVLEPCVRTLANNFVTDRSTPEVMAVGLNAIREVCARCPLIMEQDLLSDLVQYKKSKNKGVMMAARSLISLYRDMNPELLHRKERGRTAAMDLADGKATKILGYGEQRVSEDVEGIELLEQLEQLRAERKVAREQQAANGSANGKRKAGLNGSKHSGGGAAESTADADHDVMQVDGSTSDVEVVSDVDEETGSVLGQVGADDDDDEELVVESEDDDGDGDDDDEFGDEDADADAGARAAKRAQAADAASPASNSSRKRARSSAPLTTDGGAVQPDQPPSKRSHVVPATGAATSAGGPHADSDSKAEADLDREDAMSVAHSEASFATMTSIGSKIPFAARRILGAKDFDLLRKLKMKQQLSAANSGARGAKRKRSQADDGNSTVGGTGLDRDELEELADELDAEEEAGAESDGDSDDDADPSVVTPETIIGYVPRKRQDKAARMASVQAGREDREKFGKPKEKGGGTTNAEKLRNQPFQLVKHSKRIQGKQYKNFVTKQAGKNKHLKNIRKQAKQKRKLRRTK